MKHLKHFFTQIKLEIKKNGFDYGLLIIGSVFFLIFLRLFEGYKLYSFIVLLFFVIFYMVWGAYHHAKLKSLHMKNVVEYILIGFTVMYLLKLILNF